MPVKATSARTSNDPRPDVTELLRLSRRDQKKPCLVALALEVLPPKDLAVFNEAMKPEYVNRISNTGMASWLERHAGSTWQGTWNAVMAHRNEKCQCSL